MDRADIQTATGGQALLRTQRWARRMALAAVLLAACAIQGMAAENGLEARRAAAVAAYDHDIAPLLTTWCGECHRAEKHKGDVDFSAIHGGAAALGERELWGAVATKLALQEMPPEKAKQPSADERARLAGWIAALRRLDPPDPGVMGVRRLARQEYVNTIRDLFTGYTGDQGQGFPSDQIGAGFNNSLSPLLMEKLLLANDGVLDQIISSDHVELHWSAAQLDAVVNGKDDPAKGEADKGAKGGARTFTSAGHLTASLSLPEAGAYTIRVRAGADQAGKEPARLMIGLDGALLGEIVLARTKSPVAYTCKARLPAGPGHLTVTFINPATEPATLASAAGGAKAKPGEAQAKPQVRAVTIDSVELIGPPAAKQSGRSAACSSRPGKDLDKRAAARRIIEAFAARAFRRPADADEIDGLLKVFDLADNQGEVFSEAVKLMLKATLLSPQFLFRLAEDGGQGKTVDGVVAVDGWAWPRACRTSCGRACPTRSCSRRRGMAG